MSARILLLIIFSFVISIPNAETSSVTCEVSRPIVLGSGNWGSARLTTAIQKFILEKGYGCKTETLTSTSMLLLKNIEKGDVDILTELWEMNYPEEWNTIVKSGKAYATKGQAATITEQGWYVPRYVIEGDPKRGIKPMAPQLKTVKDLKKYANVFQDPDHPGKGRFVNCVVGWGCEQVNNHKLEAYGLNQYYTNYNVESDDGLDQAFATAYKDGLPIVGYTWTPTWLIDRYNLVKLSEPAYDKDKWKALNESKSGKGMEPVAYPSSTLGIAVNSNFAKGTPNIVTFLDRYKLDTSIINYMLATMSENTNLTEDEMALSFFKNYPDIWQNWVPKDVAERINKNLSDISKDKAA